MLDNGVKVASAEALGHFASFGCFVKAGSRFETKSHAGASYMIDRMAFKSTEKYTAKELVDRLEGMGGQFHCKASRDMIMYQSAVFQKDIPKMIETISQIVCRPLYLEAELEESKVATGYELGNQSFDYNLTLPDVLHSVAYQLKNSNYEARKGLLSSDDFESESLGRYLTIKQSTLETFKAKQLESFRKNWFTGDRMVVAAVGVPHDTLVALAQKYFGDVPSVNPALKAKQTMLETAALYTGGTRIIDTTNMPTSPNPDDMLLTHAQVAFEAMGTSDPDIYGLATLGSMLGGGGSFSAGGPGKGMYTRLYTQVLNRCGWVEQCNIINHNYQDNSLFGIQASFPPDIRTHHHIIPVICDQLVALTQKASKEELERAKNQLKSSMLMDMESKLSELEDIGKQILFNGQRLHILDMCSRIEEVTLEDLIRVGKRVVLSQKIESPRSYSDSKPWTPTGDGRPTVLIQGPIFKDDALIRVDNQIREWGIGPGAAKRWG